MFANLIASVLLVVLAEPIVRLLFERGEIRRASTGRATLALICLAPGLVAFSMVNILARAFFALGDTKTPMKISLALPAAESAARRRAGRAAASRAASASPTRSPRVSTSGCCSFALRKKLETLEHGVAAQTDFCRWC